MTVGYQGQRSADQHRQGASNTCHVRGRHCEANRRAQGVSVPALNMPTQITHPFTHSPAHPHVLARTHPCRSVATVEIEQQTTGELVTVVLQRFESNDEKASDPTPSVPSNGSQPSAPPGQLPHTYSLCVCVCACVRVCVCVCVCIYTHRYIESIFLSHTPSLLSIALPSPLSIVLSFFLSV